MTVDLERNPTGWMEQALCAETDPELFFPVPGEKNTIRIATAKKICDACPVKGMCRRWGFRMNDRYAILGGLTANQRERTRKKTTAGENE